MILGRSIYYVYYKNFHSGVPAGTVFHGSVTSIGGENLHGSLIGFHRHAENDPGLVRGDPSPF